MHWYINEITCKRSVKNTSMATKICLTVIRIHHAIFFKLIVRKFYLQKSIYIFQKCWLHLWKSCFVKQTKTVWYMLWCFVEALDRVGPAWPSPHRCRTFPLPLTQMDCGRFCRLWVWRRTDRWPCCPPLSTPSTSPKRAWADGSGWRNYRMSAQNLPRELVRPGSGFEELLKFI